MTINKDWFEMTDLKRRYLKNAAWIPLLADQNLIDDGKFGYSGYKREEFAAVAIIIPIDKQKQALGLSWSDVRSSWGHRPYCDDEKYYSSDLFRSGDDSVNGFYPILEQYLESGDNKPIYVHQDIVLGLGLIQEGDNWVRPDEDYNKIIKVKRSDEDKIIQCDIRTEHILDFLCFRKSGLLVATYHSRQMVFDDDPKIELSKDEILEDDNKYKWEGSTRQIEEGGNPFGSKTAVFRAGRTNFDSDEEVPIFEGPGNDNIESETFEIVHDGKKLYMVRGEMWRYQWISPADISPIVRKDEIEPKINFIVTGSGKTKYGNSLERNRGWLWFDPEIANVLLSKRFGQLIWYTEYTGRLGSNRSLSVHFGVNKIGKIIVLSKDIALLPEFYQKIWVAYNISADGGISKELTDSQMRCKPASSFAPEYLFIYAMNHLQQNSKIYLNDFILRDHHLIDSIGKSIHRFITPNFVGLCNLAKNITKLTVERINIKLLEKFDPSVDKKFRSLKRFEHFLTGIGYDGRKILSPFAGIYELRIADAHLHSDDFADVLDLIEISERENYQEIAKQMIYNSAIRMKTIADILEKVFKEEAH